MPHDSIPYDRAPSLEREAAWLADATRPYHGAERLRGLGPDSPVREYALREAAAADRSALADPSPAAAASAEAAADRLWVTDGWDENWEDRPRRDYVRWAYARWLGAATR